MTIHGFGVDSARSADAAQVGEQPLQARLIGSGEFLRLFEAQTFEGELRVTSYELRESFFDLRFCLIVGEEDDLDASAEQSWDNIALQEVDDRHAVVGGDEDAFGHETF